MKVSISKALLSMDMECFAIGEFPDSQFALEPEDDGDNLYTNFYYIFGTTTYYCLVPAEIFMKYDEALALSEHIQKHNFYYLSIPVLFDMKVLCREKFLTFQTMLDDNDAMVAVYENNIFNGEIINRWNYKELLPSGASIKRYSKNFSSDTMKNIVKVIKSGGYEYHDKAGKWKYIPIEESNGFIAHVSRESTPFNWTTRPNTSLNRFVTFVDNGTEEASPERQYEAEIGMLKREKDTLQLRLDNADNVIKEQEEEIEMLKKASAVVETVADLYKEDKPNDEDVVWDDENDDDETEREYYEEVAEADEEGI